MTNEIVLQTNAPTLFSTDFYVLWFKYEKMTLWCNFVKLALQGLTGDTAIETNMNDNKQLSPGIRNLLALDMRNKIQCSAMLISPTASSFNNILFSITNMKSSPYLNYYYLIHCV